MAEPRWYARTAATLNATPRLSQKLSDTSSCNPLRSSPVRLRARACGMSDTEWTSLGVTDEQKATLKQRMPDDYPGGIGKWLLEATADAGESDELRAQLDRIESAAKEATTAAQSAERSVEELKR